MQGAWPSAWHVTPHKKTFGGSIPVPRRSKLAQAAPTGLPSILSLHGKTMKNGKPTKVPAPVKEISIVSPSIDDGWARVSSAASTRPLAAGLFVDVRPVSPAVISPPARPRSQRWADIRHGMKEGSISLSLAFMVRTRPRWRLEWLFPQTAEFSPAECRHIGGFST